MLGAAMLFVGDPTFAQNAEQKAGDKDKPQASDAKEAQKKIDEFAEAERLLGGPAANPECLWLGRRVVSLLFYVARGTAQSVAESRLAATAGGASEQAWWSSRAAALLQVAPDFAQRFPDSTWLASAGAAQRHDDAMPHLEREAMEAFTVGLTVLLDGIEAARDRKAR
ncbi:MAG TPA: hypothetical protein VF486_09875 [Actinomycetes bacterium]